MALIRKAKHLVLKFTKVSPALYEYLCRRWNTNSLNYWDDQYSEESANERWNAQVRLQFYDLAGSAIPKEPATILDVGSGLGWGAVHLSKKCADWKIEGLDFSKQACRKAAVQTHCVDLRTGDLPGEYDYIVAVETLEHFNDPLVILKKLYQCAKKAVVLTVPYDCEISTLHPYRFNRQTFDQFPHVRIELAQRTYEPTGEIKTDMLAVLSKTPAEAIKDTDSGACLR